MNRHLAAIEARRARLLERAARERGDLAQTLQLWARPLGIIDRCLQAVHFVTSRPPLFGGAILVFTLLHPLRALKWARRAWVLWRGYRWLTQAVAP